MSSWEPAVGTILVSLADRRLRLAGAGQPIDIPEGARLEVVAVDARWDNVHAMIIQAYELRVDLRVLDGASSGAVVREVTRGEVLTVLGEEFGGYALPGWARLDGAS